jgi:methylenetetrahydrofolate reductase (NADPH)
MTSNVSLTGLPRPSLRPEPLGISFEFFPPRTSDAAESLWRTIHRLAPLEPRFVSVTYGANGSTRDFTFTTVRRIACETSIPAAAHLTCAGSSRRQVEELAESYWDAGIRHIVALRGDAPSQSTTPTEHPDGYKNAAELVAALKRLGDFEISVAAYPEIHPDAASSLADLDHLKRKVDAGATRAISQFFLDTDAFVRFYERARMHGISVPIVPGILPVTSFSGTVKFAKRCGATIPSWFTHLFEGLDETPEVRQMVAACVAVEQCRLLQSAGINEFHFYTMNRPELAQAVCHMLGLRPRRAAA